MSEKFWSDWPVALVFALFFAGAMARSQATYWSGRGLRVGGRRSARVARQLDRPGVRAAERLVARWGGPVVALSFLTIGVQTAINAAAGALRMPMRRYLPWEVLGSLAWALVYTTIGFAAVEAVVRREVGPWWWLLLVPVLVVLLASWVLRRHSEDA